MNVADPEKGKGARPAEGTGGWSTPPHIAARPTSEGESPPTLVTCARLPSAETEKPTIAWAPVPSAYRNFALPLIARSVCPRPGDAALSWSKVSVPSVATE